MNIPAYVDVILDEMKEYAALEYSCVVLIQFRASSVFVGTWNVNGKKCPEDK